MSTISEKLQRLNTYKQDIKQAIIDKGQTVEDNMSVYAEAINKISGGLDGIQVDMSVNLHDTSGIKYNYYLSAGKEVAYNGWSISGWVYLEAGKNYYVYSGSASNVIYNFYYGPNKDLLQTGISIAGKDSLLYPTKTGYYKFSSNTSGITNLTIYNVTGNVYFNI